ncbi:MATE family efflux transporter [Falsiporphyromonas endometrii]|uniref:MATE family efflux transporter n=1 Tax=Falsiporphyromonas endometrii TaxID=1387297 RepID=A0ABV9K9Q9_9PORP
MAQAKNLTTGNIRKQLVGIALPIMGTSFIQMAYSFTDMAWLGRLGSEAVASVGVASVLLWLANSISNVNKTGSEVTVGQSLGLEDKKMAATYASHNITMSLYISVTLAIIYAIFGRNIFGFYLLPKEVEDVAVNYLRIVLFGLPSLFASLAISGIYNASGLSKIPFQISAVGLVLNMILDPLLIFVFKMGVEGAAWATLLSQTLVLALFVYRLKYKDHLFGGIALFTSLKWKYSKKILSIGLPVAVLNSLFVFVNIFMGREASAAAVQSGFASHIGVATLTTGGQLEAITWNTSQGFATALSSVVAQNFAARKYRRVLDAYKYTLLYTSIFGVFGTLLFVFWGTNLFGLIVPEKMAYIAGGSYLRIIGYSQLFQMCEIATQGLFYGVGKSVPPAIISITGNYLRIPMAIYFVGLGLGLDFIWWAIAISTMMKGTGAAIWAFRLRRSLLRAEAANILQKGQ